MVRLGLNFSAAEKSGPRIPVLWCFPGPALPYPLRRTAADHPMNFLFHRYLATRDSGSGLAGFGAMLPDLWRMADRRLRPLAEPSRLASLPRGEGDVARLSALFWGIEHHLLVDDRFHRGPILEEGEKIATRYLKEAAIAGEKVLLFGHVAWEICLDGALLRRFGLEATKAGLRRELAALGPDALEAALRHHNPSLAAADHKAADAAVLGMLHQLVWGQWIDGYLDGEGITQRLEGVRRRLRLLPLEAEDRRKCAGALDRLLVEAEARLDAALALELLPPTA